MINGKLEAIEVRVASLLALGISEAEAVQQCGITKGRMKLLKENSTFMGYIEYTKRSMKAMVLEETKDFLSGEIRHFRLDYREGAKKLYTSASKFLDKVATAIEKLDPEEIAPRMRDKLRIFSVCQESN